MCLLDAQKRMVLMGNESFTEAKFEEAVIQVMRDKLGYKYVYGPDVDRDYKCALYESEVE